MNKLNHNHPILEYIEKNKNVDTFFYTKNMRCPHSTPTINDFINGYKDIMFSSTALFYELILNDRPVIEYYDFEIDQENPPSPKMIFELFEEMYSSFLIYIKYKGLNPSFVVIDSSKQNKTSLHILNLNNCFSCKKDLKRYITIMSIFLKENQDKYKLLGTLSFKLQDRIQGLDPSVYKSLNQFRMLGSTKENQSRFLKPATFHQPSMIYFELKQYEKFFIQNTKNHKLFDFKDIGDSHECSQKIERQITPIEKIGSDHINKITQMFLEQLNTGHLSSITIQGTNLLHYPSWSRILFSIIFLMKNDGKTFEYFRDFVYQYKIHDIYYRVKELDIENQLLKFWDFAQKDYKNYSIYTFITSHPDFKKECKDKFNNINLRKIDEIHADEKINSNDIGSYNERMNKDVLLLKSPMGTCKTERIKEYINQHSSTLKRIAYITYRRTLDREIQSSLEHLGFVLYENLTPKEYETNDRIVIQIDSLHKLRGKVDLLILDEFRYTKSHLIGFTKYKKIAWDTLIEYCVNTPKIIVADALLTQHHVDFFSELGRTCYVVENLYKPMQNLTCYFHTIKEGLTKYLLNLLDKNKKIVIPSNSRKFIDTLYELLTKKYPNKKIGKITKYSSFIPPKEWGEYDVLMYSPTITAGISFVKKHFDERVAYFTNNSASAENCAQMLFRVRQTFSNDIHIFINNIEFKKFIPVHPEDIDRWIKNEDELYVHTPLNLNRIKNEYIRDKFYYNFREEIRNRNLSRIDFKGVLNGFLYEQGITSKKYNDGENEEEKVLEELKKEFYNNTKIVNDKKFKKIVETELVCNNINLIEEKTDKNEEDENKILKHDLYTTFFTEPYLNKILKDVNNKDNILIEINKRIDLEFVKKNINKRYAFQNLKNAKSENYEEYLLSKIDSIERKRLECSNIERFNFYKKYHQLYKLNKFLNLLGFNSVFDKTGVKIDLEKVKEFRLENNEHYSCLFDIKELKKDINTKTMKGNTLDELLLNDLFKKFYNVRIVRSTNRKLKSEDRNFFIKGLEYFEEQGFIIPDIKHSTFGLSLHLL